MSEEYKNQLFRLAAVLYADNNYEVTPKTIHRKIIESVLLECLNPPNDWTKFSKHFVNKTSLTKFGNYENKTNIYS